MLWHYCPVPDPKITTFIKFLNAYPLKCHLKTVERGALILKKDGSLT